MFGHRDIRDSQRLARAYNDICIMKTGKPAFENLGLVALREACRTPDKTSANCAN